MDTDLIRTFLTLAQCNSFSTAAEKLTISQSTLSHRLHQLEEELGNILVCRNRGKRNFHLTEAGLEFIPLAEDWMHLSRSIKGFHLGAKGAHPLQGLCIRPIRRRSPGRFSSAYLR